MTGNGTPRRLYLGAGYPCAFECLEAVITETYGIPGMGLTGTASSLCLTIFYNV